MQIQSGVHDERYHLKCKEQKVKVKSEGNRKGI